MIEPGETKPEPTSKPTDVELPKSKRWVIKPKHRPDMLDAFDVFDLQTEKSWTISDPTGKILVDVCKLVNAHQHTSLLELLQTHGTHPASSTADVRRRILDEAVKCVCADRNRAYGAPENNFQVIADYWNVLLGDKLKTKITAHDVGMCMTLMKIARMKTSPDKLDHYVDAAGYLACTGGFTAKP